MAVTTERAVLDLEKKSNSKFAEFNSVESLANSETKALLIYSENDKLCCCLHYDILKSALDGKDNISFMLVKNKVHNPNYTEDAVKLLDEFSKVRTKLVRNKKSTKEDKKRFVVSYDWKKMAAQDEVVWKRYLSI